MDIKILETTLKILISIGAITFVLNKLYSWFKSYMLGDFKKIKSSSNEFNNVEAFQKLAGIIPHNKEKAAFNPANIKMNEHIFDKLRDAEYEMESDPLASLPMSRISKEAKLKIAEIVREDIRINCENTHKQ